MSATSVKGRIEKLIGLARLFERCDADPSLIGAGQYQHLSRMVQLLLAEDLPVDAVRAVLRAFPATAVLYENLHYDRSGLSQSPLDAAVSSELSASEVIERVRAGARPTA